MIEPINARTLINNGWTIKNRRLLQQRIGKKECAKLYDAYTRVSQAGNSIPSFIGNIGKILLKSGVPTLVSAKNSLKLILGVGLEYGKSKFKHPLTFVNENINIDNIDSSVRNLEQGARKIYQIKFPETDMESETLKKLYSPEFAPKRRTDSKGYAVTTVIDKETNKPVEVYVKRISKTNHLENWGIYKKEGDEYQEIGFRSFGINKILGAITPGYMQNGDSEKKYAGIGLRLHQIAVERMMQTGCDEVNLESLPESFAFHYKAGFRLTPDYLTFTKDSLDSYINFWHQKTGLSEKTLRKDMITMNVGDLICLDNKTLEKFMVKAYKKNKKIPFEKGQNQTILNMTMSKEWLETWKTMAQLQPILL